VTEVILRLRHVFHSNNILQPMSFRPWFISVTGIFLFSYEKLSLTRLRHIHFKTDDCFNDVEDKIHIYLFICVYIPVTV
jgi:hypothetical protein